MDDFEKEVKLDFLNEALQLLDDSEQAFLALEGDQHNADLMNQIFRLAHNLKGTSRAVGFGDVAEFTHEFENLILKIKEGQITISSSVVSLLLECNDHVSVMIKMLNMDLNSRFDSKEIIEKIHVTLTGKVAIVSAPLVVEEVAESFDTISAEDLAILEKFEADLNGPSEVHSILHEEKRAESFIPVQNVVEEVKPKAVSAVPSSKAGNEDDSIRVSLSRVEMLNNVVGELVIIQTVLNQHRDEVSNPLMLKSLSQLAKLSKEIQIIELHLFSFKKSKFQYLLIIHVEHYQYVVELSLTRLYLSQLWTIFF